MEIRYEDDAILAVNKPAGLVVNRAESVEGETLQDWVEARYNFWNIGLETEEAKIFRQRSGIAHRLDKETSGILLIAKTPQGLAWLMRQFKAREIKKSYQALVWGKVDPAKGWIIWPIKRKGLSQRKFGVDPLGKPATTFYQTAANYEIHKLPITQLILEPKTGRTHQLRVHLSFIKHPIIGDKLYASENYQSLSGKLIQRHCLHASAISFTHPINQKRMTISAPLASDMQQIISKSQRKL